MKFKFITLNVEHGGKLFDDIVRFVKHERPDILIMQEVYDSSLTGPKRFRAFSEYAKSFKEFLPYSAFQSACFNITENEKGMEEGNAIYSKFKITSNLKTEIGEPYGIVDERGVSDFSNSPSILQSVELYIDGKTLNILNLHGIWGFDGLDSENRIKMAKTIASIVKGKKNVILAGDTNFTFKAEKTMKIIEDSGVKSIFGDTLKSTFNMKYKKDVGFATAAVDMIFAGDSLKIITKSQPRVDVSDHYPLMVELLI